MSTESELVKEAFSDSCFLKQLRGLEAMLRVRARASPGCAATAENDTVFMQENGVLAGVVENDLALKAVNGENDSESELLECADVLADRCPPCARQPREKARAQKWCSDSGAVDARRDTDADRPGVSARIHDCVSVISSSASSHACVSFLDALLAAPARAPAASTLACRTARSSVHLCMVHAIQVVLVASCLCRRPPVTA